MDKHLNLKTLTCEYPCQYRNYRTWIFMACYGFSFGVELTVDNNLAPYIQAQFSKSLLASGNFAAIFGLLNFFSRPGGALLQHFSFRLNAPFLI